MKHDGKSLNDSIRPGPKLQPEIVDVLTRFRRAPVALSADISEMFLQVGLQDKDRPFHKFLWRDFRRLLFGNTASPFCAQYVIHAHAQAHIEKFPATAESVDNSMYVDDVLDSSETIEGAQDLRRQLSDLWVWQVFGCGNGPRTSHQLSQASPRVTGYLLLKLTKKNRLKPRLWESCGILKEMYSPSEWNLLMRIKPLRNVMY